MSSRKRPASAIKRAKERNEEKQPQIDARMKKKLVLKPVVLEFDFGDEWAVSTSSAGSRKEGALKWARR